MKYLSVFILAAACLCACSEKETDEPLRPGGEKPADMPAVVFSPENTGEHTVDGADGEIHIILYREAGPTAPACECRLSLTEGADFARVDGTAAFGKGATTAVARLGYSAAKMGADRRDVTVRIAESGAMLTIHFTRLTAGWTDQGERLLFNEGTIARVRAWSLRGDNATEWRLEGAGVERRFTVSDKGDVRPAAAGGVVAAANYGHGELWPCVTVPSATSGTVTALNVCACPGTTLAFPHTEYIFALPAEGARIAVTEICDGWLLPVVAVDGLLLDPAANRWTAPALVEADGTTTVFGPYHNSSPLFRVNAAPLLSAWRIETAGSKAAINDCFSGFANADVFDFTFRISGEGTIAAKGNSTVITFGTPMHNCRPDGGMSATSDCRWGRVSPTILTIKH